jgi:hypothetical protein
MEPRKVPPTDISKASFPPPTSDKAEKPVNKRDSFLSIAKDLRLDVWDLIEFNFPGSRNKPDIVNWYLYNKMGCREMTADRKNYTFSNGMKIFYPKTPTPAPITTPAPAPGPGVNPLATHPFRKGWTNTHVNEYHNYVLGTAGSLANSFGSRFDCANFALYLLTTFAQARYLPVAFQYVGGILRCESDSIVSFPEFARDAKNKIGAPDLNNASYQQTVALPSFDVAKSGDILTQGKHVMVVFKNPSMINVPGVTGMRRVAEILQGNLDTAPFPWKEIPVDTRVQHRAYDLKIKAGYKNEGNGWEHRDDAVNLQDMLANGATPKRWNFSWFNQVYGFPPL